MSRSSSPIGLQTRKVPDENSVGPQQLAHRLKLIRRIERSERPASDVDQLVQHEALVTQEALDVAEQRLLPIQRDELHLAFDDQRV